MPFDPKDAPEGTLDAGADGRLPASHVIDVREPGRVPLRIVVTDALPVGRHGSGLLLGDERLSRHHCEFRVRHDGTFVVEDAGSSNGTFVNGTASSGPTALSPGDVVLIGDTTIVVDRDPKVEGDAEVGHRSTLTATIVGTDLAERRLRASVVGGTITMVFSDIVDSTAQNVVLGDRAWFELLRRHDLLLREEVAANGGTEVKGQGDGFFLTFPSARRGLLFAVAAQRRLAALRADDETFPLRVRIGVHTGEVIHEVGDLFGRHVNLAARVASQAGADEITVSSLVHELVVPMGDFRFGPVREVTLKGSTASA